MISQAIEACGENEDGTQFSILGSNGRYNKEYLNTKGSYVEKSTPGKDGSYVETTITPVDTAKVVQAAVGGLKSKAASYLKDYNTANKIWMEVLGNEEPLGRSGVGVGDESTKEFTAAFIEYGRKKLPNFKYELPFKAASYRFHSVDSSHVVFSN